jgi:polyhydroxyalkanoate synthase subunit PhaC
VAQIDDTRDLTDAAAPLDMLLTQAAFGPMRRLSPGLPGMRFLGGLVRRPDRVAARARDFAGQLAQITAGTSDLAPSSRDKRFSDPAWSENPVLRRLVQAYLAFGQAAEGLLADVPLEWRDAERVRFAGSNVVDALSPSNNPLISPVAWKSAIDTAGANIIRGPRNLVRDLATAPRVPTMVDQRAYEVGRDLAVTPGAVVLRTRQFELIQYRPTTATVRTIPLLMVPPTINKYYVLDLAPGRSMVEYFLSQGQQVFMISWRNPDARHRDWGLDTYAAAVIEAMDAVQAISGSDVTHLLGACSGGMIASMTAAVLAATGRQNRLAGLSLLVTLLDQSRAGLTSAMIDEDMAAQAVASARRAGYLDGRKLAEVFAWLRPNDLIWNYWVNNYLQAKRPPKFDILFWNADTTRMAAQLYADFIDVGLHNRLAHPGSLTVLGTEVDLGQITLDSYVLAGSADHICPWQACYRSGQLLGGNTRFVLSTSGHVAALVNPPGNPKASFRVAEDNSVDAELWTEKAATEKGSWWTDFTAWLGERSGPEKPAPEEVGAPGFRIREDAPGSYVLDS